ncbi:MAG: CHAT domain-containing protein [Gemmatimonadota bacterium]
MLADLARWAGTAPPTGVRVSAVRKYRPCVPSPAGKGWTLAVSCGEQPPGSTPSEMVRLAGRARAAVRAGTDPGALHALALMDMLWADSAGISVERAIHNLQAVAQLSERPAPVLGDLAAAYLMRAERTQTPRDLLLAAEAAARAVEQDSSNQTALFNLAVALETFGLAHEAANAWRAYIRADSTSGWAAHARKRLRQHGAPGTASAGAPLLRLAVVDPQQARSTGWDRLLGEWGAAVLENDPARARHALDRAGELGAALERAGRDATLARAVDSIRAASRDASQARTLAAAHHLYARARRYFESGDYRAAEPLFAKAGALATSSPALREWAHLFEGTTQVLDGRAMRGEPLLRAVAARSDTVREPALAGRARWVLATAYLRGDRYQDASASASEAAQLLTRAGERENTGGALGVASEARFAMGDLEGGYASAHHALAMLRTYPASGRSHVLLFALGRAVAADGSPRAAVHVQSEGLAVAERTGNTIHVAEARLARARLFAAAGRPVRAAADAAAGRELVMRMRAAGARAWFMADLRMTEAALASRADPAAAANLDSVLGFFGPRDNPLRVFPALLARAETRLALGDSNAARADLQRAVAMLEDRRGAITEEHLRASLTEQARGVFDKLVMLHVAAGRTTDALIDMDRARASLTRHGPRESAAERARFAAPSGEILVEYALVGDTLLAWVVSGSRVRFARTTVDAKHFARTVGEVRSSLENQAEEGATRRELARLYDWLVRPVEAWLGEGGVPLVVVADGDVAAAPFPALFDTHRRRYLVEKHVLRFATSAREAARRARHGAGAGNVLLVADPAFDPAEHPGLERLSGAAAEVRAIMANYPQSVVLDEEEASASALLAAVPRASVIHYAGHAIFDDGHPERSSLVLASTPVEGRPADLTAAELAGLDLRHVRLVVLSACQTVRSGGGRAQGFAGLAGAILAAGAGGVVGSSWLVNDQLTLALMPEFHRAYRAGEGGPEALRTAQLALLHSERPELRSPAAWAGFRYVGR